MKRWIVPVTVALALAGEALGQTAPDAPDVTVLGQREVVGTAPLPGYGIDRDKVSASTVGLDSKDIAREGTPDAVRALNQQVGGVTVDSASGNPFQPTFFYHGFQASALQGTPQGLAIYVNGMRFNQPFGDTVDWDLIPDIAIDRLDLEGSNPVFGLNALGGSVNIQLKNGFSYHGAEADLSGGSFGQVQGEFHYGKQAGNMSAYIAGNGLHQDGWRDLQSSDIQNLYGDLGWRSDTAEVHLNTMLANSVLNGPGTSPVQLLAADPAAQFTAPNTVGNQYAAVNLTANIDVTETTSIQTLFYYRYFHQHVANGNAPNDTPCAENPGFLCFGAGLPSTTTGGALIPDFLNGGPYSRLDTQTTITNAYGASAQVTNADAVFGLGNHVVAGVSFDGARNDFSGSSYIGGLTPLDRVFVGPGALIDEPGNNVPVRVAISDAYYGLYVTDTLDLTSRLSLTGGGRFNVAQINLSDQNGGDLSGDHFYTHFNPAIGATYKVTPWLTLYGGYAEANRAPTPAELSCASPANSCSLANFFVGDPNLKQVVARTIELGLRGAFALRDGARLSYDLGYFHSDLDDDIAFINSTTLGRAYFANIGATRRQGIDASLELKTDQWIAYIAYAYLEATFQSGFTEPAGSNPAADANGNITIQPGDRLPGIPANQLKLGVTYKVTDRWTVGASAIAASGAYLFGDDANLTAKLPAYVTLNLSTSYQITDNIQIFGWAQNVTNQRYYTYGTFSPVTSVFLAQAPNATNPRSYSLAAPVGGFVGVRVVF
jgi:iron complex outermembrane recepter protein